VKLPVPKGASSITIGSTSLAAATPGVPEYCLVAGTIDRDINFNVGLPTSWNGKLMMEGNGGFAGSIPTWAIDYYVGYQYAVVGTDMGQTGNPADLLNRPDRVANLEYRSTHLVAVAAKSVIRAYYGAAPSHAYFEGCSRGGSQGMDEASRYPDDFDGIIAGAPALQSGGTRIWNEQAVFPGGPSNAVYITTAKVTLLSQAVISKCDKLDGVADGIVAEPRACNFTPKVDLPRCRSDVDGPNCFTKAQVTALQKIHEGPKSNGQSIGVPYYFSGNEGYDYGPTGTGEDDLDYADNVTGYPGNAFLFPDLFDVGIPSYNYWTETQYLRYVVFNDPSYLLQNFDFNNPQDVRRYTRALAPQYPASPDLSEFGNRGGKLIMWHGLADSLINSEMSRTFYEAGAAALGGYKNIKGFDRLFLVPGTLHCGGGPGPWSFNPVPALEHWVENGQAPKSIVGVAPDSNTSQPICAYPKQARLRSPSADPAAADSYQCVNVSHEINDID
jgi:feruloyl esterase